MRRAAARGLLRGPAAGDLREPRTWAYLAAVAEGLDVDARVEALRLQHAHAVALYALGLDAAGIRQLGAAVDQAADALEQLLRPWVDPAASRGDVRALEARWEEAWGRFDDPATRRKIAEACRQMAPARKPEMPRRRT